MKRRRESRNMGIVESACVYVDKNFQLLLIYCAVQLAVYYSAEEIIRRVIVRAISLVTLRSTGHASDDRLTQILCIDTPPRVFIETGKNDIEWLKRIPKRNVQRTGGSCPTRLCSVVRADTAEYSGPFRPQIRLSLLSCCSELEVIRE